MIKRYDVVSVMEERCSDWCKYEEVVQMLEAIADTECARDAIKQLIDDLETMRLRSLR